MAVRRGEYPSSLPCKKAAADREGAFLENTVQGAGSQYQGKAETCIIIPLHIAGWSSLEAHLAHNQEVGGSNPPLRHQNNPL